MLTVVYIYYTWIRNGMCLKTNVEKLSVMLSNLLLSCVDGNIKYFNLMEYVTICLDSTNKLEHWYARHNNVYSLLRGLYMFQPIHRSSSGPPVHVGP